MGTKRPHMPIEKLQQALVDTAACEQLARMFNALGDPTRLRILLALAQAEVCVGDLAAAVDLSLSATSHQLRLLRELRIVRHRREGKHVYYTLDDEHIQDLLQRGLEHVQHA